MKRVAVLTVLLMMTAFARAQSNGNFSYVSISCSAVTATGPCQDFQIPAGDSAHTQSASSFTWQTSFIGGTPTSITVVLEGSIDRAVWTTIDSSTSTAGEVRSKTGTAYKYFRCNATAYSRNGTSLNCSIMPTASSSSSTGTATDIQSLSSDPGTCSAGNIWYNTGSGVYKVCPAGVITSLSTAAPAFANLTPGTNTAGAFHIGTGSSLDATGSGSITATAAPWAGITGVPTTLAGYGITDAVPSSRTVNGKALSANITLDLSSSDFSGQTLAAARLPKQDLMDAASFCADAGASGTTYTCSLSPAITAYVTGTHYRFKPNTANTAASTINFNSLGAKTIKKVSGGSITTDVVANDLRAGQWVDLVYDGTNMQMQSQTSGPCATCITGSPTNHGVAVGSSTQADSYTAAGTANQPLVSAGASADPLYKSMVDLNATEYAAGGGTAQAQTATLAPAATSLATGLQVRWLPAAANTSAAPTLAVNGLTAKAITKFGTTALVANDLTTTAIAVAVYDGTEWQLLNPQTATGSGSISGLTTGYIPKASSSSNIANSACDDGITTASTVTCTEPIAVPSVQMTGSNGGADGTEGTGAGLTAASGHDLMWPDSTAHRWKMNNNNGGATTLAGFIDKLNVFAATSSAELAGVLTDEVGSGAAMFSPKRDIMDAATFCTDAVGTDSYACSLSPAITAYVTGVHYRFVAGTANTGAASINLNSLGAKTIVKVAGGITTTLADNDIRSGQWVDVVYDGTNMQMQSILGNASAGSGTTNMNWLVSGNNWAGLFTSGDTFCSLSGYQFTATTLQVCTVGITTSGATPGAGNVIGVFFSSAAAPGTTVNEQVTVMKNESNTTMTCTITSAITSCNDTTHTFSVTGTDRISYRITSNGSPAASQWSILLKMTN